MVDVVIIPIEIGLSCDPGEPASKHSKSKIDHMVRKAEAAQRRAKGGHLK